MSLMELNALWIFIATSVSESLSDLIAMFTGYTQVIRTPVIRIINPLIDCESTINYSAFIRQNLLRGVSKIENRFDYRKQTNITSLT